MWTYYPELLAKPVPRYTSYPTAADFGEIGPKLYGDVLQRVRGEISLYIHIPFCEKICFYCGCNTATAGRRQRLESYLAALHKEIDLVGSLVSRDCKVSRIAFGGGSPNAIAPTEFLTLLDALRTRFDADGSDISIELDPRTMTADWAEAIATAQVGRASLGVQTFAAHCQEAIGRVQPDALICRTLDWLRDAGVHSLNFDLMYGLPGQSLEDLADSLEYSTLLGADRIALFGYAHVPQVVPRQRAIDTSALPGAEERFRMAAHGYDYLTGNGYEAIGFDHFAKPGDPLAVAAREKRLKRNFQGFTDDSAPALIGLGSSAISSFPELLAQNEKNSGRYRMLLSQDRLTTTRGIIRTAEDQLHGRVIEELLCFGRATLPPCLLAQVAGRLTPFIERGIATLEGFDLTIAPGGIPYARTIAALFDPYREAAPRGFSSAV